VETGTGIFVDANNTGTDARKADTDGDGRVDGAEVTGPIITNPILADTDGDTFSDGSEVASGHNPNDPNHNPNTTKLADSKAEFSGTQGQNDWFYGYRDLNADGGGTYNVTNFVEFPATAFINNSWDLAVDVAPWTLVASEETHPAGPDPLHWAIRRWVATEVTNTTPLTLRYFLRKSNAGCGNGVTGSVLVNGQELDNVIIAYNNGTGVTRTYYANINPGDVIDFAIKSAGTHIEDNSINNDWCDGTAAWLVVDSAIPANATQPDGTPFVPVGTPEFTDITVSNATGQVTIKWNSIAGATYKIDATSDLKTWNTLATGLASGGAETTYTETLPAQRPATRFYRVARE
jgi:hypothetical protein